MTPRRGAGARRGPALVVVSVALGVAACGVPLDDTPRELAVESVPYGLLETSTTSIPEPRSLPTFRPTTVYLRDNEGHLVQVRRELPGEQTVENAVLSLLTEPTESEGASGLGTAISSTTVLRGVSGPEAGLVTIDLSSEISDVSPQSVRLALAQIVYTATAVPGVDQVLFQVDGEARQVPNAAGESTAEPLTRADYREFLPPPTTTTTVPAEVPELREVPDAPGAG